MKRLSGAIAILLASAWIESTFPSPGWATGAQGGSESTPNGIPTGDRGATFSDLQTHWASPFANGLVSRHLLRVSLGSAFQPSRIVTRAEFATLLPLTFIYQGNYRANSSAGGDRAFVDLSPTRWDYEAIRLAYRAGFLSGYPDGRFRPDAPMTRVQAIAALAAGLRLSADPRHYDRTFLASIYRDADTIPAFAIAPVAILTHHRIVANHPDPHTLDPNRPITRAELVAMLYQALAQQGWVPPIASRYTIDPTRPLFDLPAGQITLLEVNLSQRRVTAFRGDRKLKSYPIGIGRAGWETPTGTYRVRQAIERPSWKNPFTGDVIPGGDPDNPLGNYWIGFWTNGKEWSGFHGTPNRASVGQAVSHGCLRMFNEDIQELFRHVTPNTTVRVVR